MKRKRRQKDTSTIDESAKPPMSAVQRDILEQQYPSVLPLRQFVLNKLPRTSKIRRRRIVNLGRQDGVLSDNDQGLPWLLDNALVCVLTKNAEHGSEQRHVRFQQYKSFSQKPDDSTIVSSGGVQAASFLQSEILKFVVWLLFSKAANVRPKHILCEGFRRKGAAGEGEEFPSDIPDIKIEFPNSLYKAMKEDPWPELLFLLGQSGESIMIDLLLDHAIFVPMEAGFKNVLQLSGIPLSEVSPGGSGPQPLLRKPSEIVLVRSRIFYGQPILSSRGQVTAGFRWIHVLNHCTPAAIPHQDEQGDSSHAIDNTTKLMMYIFPRQFKLHNVFTSSTNPKVTAQKFHDYTWREDEIKEVSSNRHFKTPKRLRFAARSLVDSLQKQHKKCSYTELLRHYCPVKSNNTPPSVVTDISTPVEHVSAFCQAVITRLVPHGFFGEGTVGRHNLAQACKRIDHFVKLRRFEGMSLQYVIQGFKIVDIPWLQALPSGGGCQKTCSSDYEKRREIFYEFLYWVFDSLLMPLLRANFYITESNTDRSKVFYFRYEAWRSIAEPSMKDLKENLLEEIPIKKADQILAARKLGYSNLRLLPKGAKLRPIMNLRRRIVGREKQLLPSINSLLAPAHTALQYERTRRPSKLGQTMFSISDIYETLKSFKKQTTLPADLYFAKVDVKAAFDTIPQSAAIALMSQVFTVPEYHMGKHVEIKPRDRAREPGQKQGGMIKRWHRTATTTPGRDVKRQLEDSIACKKKNTVFIGSAATMSYSGQALSSLVADHVAQNMVRVGKKYYRQKRGIPQGSILSSILCNYFYADLERRHLAFLSDDSLLMRLTDDFLLVTPHKSQAEQFVQVMLAGLPDFGVEVGPSKTLINFDMKMDEGEPIAKLPNGAWFPYCGTVVNCATLDVARDLERLVGADLSFSITVEHTREPGRSFQAKSLNFFKVQSHMIYFDTSHNSISTVLDTLEAVFRETARKMLAYYRSLPRKKQPRPALVIRTISEVIDGAYRLLTGESRSLRYPRYKCDLRRAQVVQTASKAFITVLSRKQTGFREVCQWLQQGMTSRG